MGLRGGERDEGTPVGLEGLEITSYPLYFTENGVNYLVLYKVHQYVCTDILGPQETVKLLLGEGTSMLPMYKHWRP